LLEALDLKLPALLTIQTGINEPRYASIMGIAKASKREIEGKDSAALGLEHTEIGEEGSQTRITTLTHPPQTKMAEIIDGSPGECAGKLAVILKDKELL